tara:strand:+ start:602 stop:1516 length:915 start_codon:yes stop_codon:yes gene_type:complete
MALVTNSNYAGKAAGFYISAALKEAKSLEHLTMIENIKYKSNIQIMSNDNALIQNANCNVNLAGTLTLDEVVLEPKNLMIQTDLCKAELLDSWEALQLRAGAGAPPPPSFTDYVISYLGEIIANGVESDVWVGNNGAGRLLGFLDGGAGVISTGAGIVASVATAPYTAGNIIGNLQQLVSDWQGSTAVNTMGKEDVTIYVSKKTWSLYISAISALTATPWGNMNKDYETLFEGHTLTVCPGMADDKAVVAQKSNLYFGTDLLSDQTRIQLLDMSALDGSDNIRCVARYSGGVQCGVNADIVYQS